MAIERIAWFYTMEAPLRFIITTRVFDLAVHAADIRRATGIEPWFSAAGGRFAGEYALTCLPRFVAVDRLPEVTGNVLQTVDGVTTQTELSPAGLALVAPNGGHTAAIDTDGGTWTLLTWGRIGLDEAESHGLVRIEGDRALVGRYLGVTQTP